jgi:uncharacterized protein (TIRG00374 family)
MNKNKIIKNTHIKWRATFEIIGLFVIIGLSINQKDTLLEALKAISGSNLYVVLLAVLVFWLTLPLTALSYRQLIKHRIPLFNATLAQLAGSGPGRIVPGGFGRLGLAVLHLRKIGIPTQIAIIASAMNSLFGVVVNSIILLILLSQHNDIQTHFRYGTGVATILLIVIPFFTIFGIFEYLSHRKHASKPLKKLSKSWAIQIKLLLNEPFRIVKLIFIALLILASNVAILLLASKSTDIQISVNDAIIALSVGVFVGGILPTPGGVGGVEAGTASALIALGYDPTVSTTVAVLYRMVTYWQPLIPGTVSYFYLRDKNQI